MNFFGAIVICSLVSTSLAALSVAKRGIFGGDLGGGGGAWTLSNGNGYDTSGNGWQDSGAGAWNGGGSGSFGKLSYGAPQVSPAEIASAIQAAKEASDAVKAAEQRVWEAKEDVLHQQHLATQKQADAALALQRTEAAAAVQQQEAKAAAQALVRAQERLARAKSEVSDAQRIAAAKTAHAAAIIQKSATAAAHEIQKTDNVARKIQSIQSSGNSALRQAAAAKQGSLTAASAAVAAAANSENTAAESHGSAGPWYGQKFIQWG